MINLLIYVRIIEVYNEFPIGRPQPVGSLVTEHFRGNKNDREKIIYIRISNRRTSG